MIEATFTKKHDKYDHNPLDGKLSLDLRNEKTVDLFLQHNGEFITLRFEADSFLKVRCLEHSREFLDLAVRL